LRRVRPARSSGIRSITEDPSLDYEDDCPHYDNYNNITADRYDHGFK